MSDALAISFHYGELSPEVAAAAQSSANRIRTLVKKTTEAIILTGNEIAAVKALLPHGAFLAWLSSEFGMSERTAQNYMRVANWAEGKYETVSYLQLTTVDALAAPRAPAEAQQEVMRRIEAGERLSDDDIKNVIRQKRALAAMARVEAKRTPRQRRSRKEREAEQQRRELALKREEAAEEVGAQELIAFLKAQLTDKDISTMLALINASGWRWIERVRAAVEPLHEAALDLGGGP